MYVVFFVFFQFIVSSCLMFSFYNPPFLFFFSFTAHTHTHYSTRGTRTRKKKPGTNTPTRIKSVALSHIPPRSLKLCNRNHSPHLFEYHKAILKLLMHSNSSLVCVNGIPFSLCLYNNVWPSKEIRKGQRRNAVVFLAILEFAVMTVKLFERQIHNRDLLRMHALCLIPFPFQLSFFLCYFIVCFHSTSIIISTSKSTIAKMK